jgi:carbonic anhydrase
MPHLDSPLRSTLPYDLTAALVVFLVALPLCLGLALASGAPLFSGLLAGIIGGVIVGAISKSQASVSGPAAGLAAVVASQIETLGSFEGFLAALVIAGVFQIGMGLGRLGFIAEFFPSSVVKGLLAAIGVILVLKQIPHALGHDPDPDGEMAFLQPDNRNTFSEIFAVIDDLHGGAAAIGILSLLVLIAWERIEWLKKSPIPAAIFAVFLGVGLAELFEWWNPDWAIEVSHLVQVPVTTSAYEFIGLFTYPDPEAWLSFATWRAGVTLAIVASLATMLNLEAVEKIDPLARTSSPNRELVAQGIGNVLAGALGAIPITSVIVRSSVNLNAGGRTRLATIVHGFLILGCVTLCPTWLNRIPLSCLAAILIVTGFKLATPGLFLDMWRKGRDRFWPFVFTVTAIVLTDLLVGVIIGMLIAIGFILWSNYRKPIRRIVEKHIGGEVLHLRLANQVSFLNRAAMNRILDQIPRGGHVLIDATETDYIDGDLLELIHDFERKVAPSRGVTVSLQGFHDRYQMVDRIQYVDYSTRDLQRSLTPAQALALLQEGHERFISGQRLPRDFHRQVDNTADGQFPFAVVLSCIDSRTPAEFIFDLGVGDIFSVRIAGNVATQKVIGSIEYACAVAGAKLVLVLGHTRCGAVTAAVELALSGASAAEATGCTNLDGIIVEIQQSIVGDVVPKSAAEKSDLVEDVCSRNVLRTIAAIRSQSPSLAQLEREGRISVVGVKYDVADGRIQFLSDDAQIGKTRLRSEE